MIQNLKAWVRRKMCKLILWAARDQLLTQARQDGYAAGRTASLAVCDDLRGQMKALQMLDSQFNGSGKIIIAARVRGQDIVQIIDIPTNCSMDEWRERVYRIKQMFGIEVRICDTTRYAREHLVMKSKPLP